MPPVSSEGLDNLIAISGGAPGAPKIARGVVALEMPSPAGIRSLGFVVVDPLERLGVARLSAPRPEGARSIQFASAHWGVLWWPDSSVVLVRNDGIDVWFDAGFVSLDEHFQVNAVGQER